MKIAYFTAGTVGAGHLVHGLAYQRGLRRAGFTGAYRMFGPPLPFPAAWLQTDYEPVEIQTDLRLRDRHLAQTSDLAQKLREYQPDLLLVDLFWAPLRWVLPALKLRAWLLVRICPPTWLASWPGMPFAPEQYERIVGTEPFHDPALDSAIEPVVLCNPDECQPPGALREHLGLPAGEELVVVLHAGERGEFEQLQQAAGVERPVTLDLFEPGGLFPAAEWLPGADRIVAGVGYNAFWEARWLGYAERTTFIPFRRTIDDQFKRLRELRHHAPRENGADTLARWILG